MEYTYSSRFKQFFQLIPPSLQPWQLGFAELDGALDGLDFLVLAAAMDYADGEREELDRFHAVLGFGNRNAGVISWICAN